MCIRDSHGGIEKDKIQEENIEGIKNGIENLYRHIDNIKTNLIDIEVVEFTRKINELELYLNE